MPSDARGADLLSTPSSPRPSSSASSSTSSSSAHLPRRTTSMDSLPTAAVEKVVSPAAVRNSSRVVISSREEHIPTRTVATGPKVNTKAMIFVKTGPAQLYKSAAEQMKKAQTVKEMRRLAVQEEEPDWQQSTSTSSRSAAAATHDDDWQANLESWKKSRRKRNEDALERVIEVKKAENEKNRRMSSGSIGLGGKTGRRLNVVVHDDDDNNDLSDLGLSRGTSYPGVLTDTSNTDIVTSIGKLSKLNSSGASSTITAILDSPPSSLMIMSTGQNSAKLSADSAVPATTTTTAAINSKNRTTTCAVPLKNMAPLAAGLTTTTNTSSKYLLDNDNNSTDNVNDNKDAKSDAGFCTGSDTGSDGLFPDDNISDTSSALGDKKEAHELLLDAVVLHSKDDEVMNHTTASSITSSISSSITCSSLTKQDTMEYTYDKAIEGYKQYAENSIKKRTSSMTSLNSISSGCVRYDKESIQSAVESPKGHGKIGNKLDFFVKEMDKEFTKPDPKPLVIMREKSPKVDITKRRTMFEMGHSVSTANLYSVEPKLEKRQSSDMTASTGNLKSKVASFESFEIDKGKQQGITPPRDAKFKEKLANFSTKPSSNESAQLRKKVPEKDKNFHQKLASFTSLENADENKSMVRKSLVPQLNTASLKSKIASFEQLDQQDNSVDFHLADGNQNQTREKSISMECLTRYSASRRHEAKLKRGSVEALNEEGPELSRKDHNWRPPRVSRSPEKSKFSSQTFSFDETYSSSFKTTSGSERRSQLQKSSPESKDEDFKFRNEKQVDANKIRDGAPSTVSRILPSTKFVGQVSSVLCPPLDLSSPQSEAPISTSSPRQNSSLNNIAFPQSTPTNTSKSLTTESLRSENKNASSSSSSSTKVDMSESVVRYSQEDDYDDVLNTVESFSLRSSVESDRPHYTDDDINEVIDDLGSPVKPEVTSKGVGPPAKSAPPPRRILPTAPTRSSAPPPAGVDLQPAPVVIVDWSESGGPVAPPSEPPPPPPPDDDDNDSEVPQISSSPPPPPSSSTGTCGPGSHGYYPSFEVPATSPTPSDCPSLVPSETYASSECSRTSAKEQLRQRRSDFLGTSHVAAEPPLDALLQQQRAADRQMLETRRSLQLSTHQVLSDIDQSSSYRSKMLKSSLSVDAGKSLSRDRYTWEDRLRDDTTQPNAGLNDTDDGYGYHNKLEELEAEMLRHDRAVLSRTRSQQSGTTGRVLDSGTTGAQQLGTPGTTSNDDKMDSSSSARAASPTYDDVTVQSGEPPIYDNSNRAATMSAGTATSGTDQQRDDSYYEDNVIQQQQNNYNQQNTQQSKLQHHKPHQQQREQHQELQSLSYQPEVRGPEKPLRTYNSCYDSTAPVSAPEVLLRKKMPAPPPEEDNYEAVDPGQGQHMSKQSRQALSATPRTRLQQGESWIRRKAEQARDYNKHWLIQEAEQRRLEQRDRRISKGEARHEVATTTTSNTCSGSSTSPHTLTSALSLTKLAPSPYHKPQHSTQLLHSNMNNTNITRTDYRSSETSVTNRTSSSSCDLSLNKALDPYSTSCSTSAPPPPDGARPQEPVNRTTDPNAWRNQATTYQPLPTAAPSNGWDSKPLPDSIISTLTARVQNRSRPGSANSSSGRPSPYSSSMGGSSGNLHYAANYPATTNGNAYTTDENYHDYMNTDAINLQRQQQYQSQEQQQQQHQIINSENQQQQQPLYANYSMKSNTGSSASINTDHYAQHHQTSPTTSLPLSSSSSSLSPLQQQQQYHPHHHSPHPSPTQTNNLVANRNNNNNSNKNNNSSKTSPMSSSSSSSVASSSKPKDQRLSVSGNKKCCHCGEELGRGAAMIIESLKLFYHIPCFVCCVCGLQLGNGESGADVRVRNHALHCHNCYSNDQGMKFSEV